MRTHKPKPPSRATWIATTAITLLLALIPLLSGCTSRSSGTLARIRREGVIRIGHAIEVPYIYVDQNGSLTGLEHAMANAIVAGLGNPRIEWVQTEFGSLINGLEAGRFDVVAAGMFITPQQGQRVAFSEPTFHVRQALLVRAGNPQKLHSYADLLRPPGVRVAVLGESIEHELLRRTGVPASLAVVVPDALTGRVAVESGLVDCLALSAPTIRYMAELQNLGSTEAAEPFEQPEAGEAGLNGYGAAAFRPADTELRDAWNAELADYVGSPAHLSALECFGFGVDAAPASVTTSAILSGGAP